MRKHNKKILLGLVLILILLVGGFLLYASFFIEQTRKRTLYYRQE